MVCDPPSIPYLCISQVIKPATGVSSSEQRRGGDRTGQDKKNSREQQNANYDETTTIICS